MGDAHNDDNHHEEEYGEDENDDDDDDGDGYNGDNETAMETIPDHVDFATPKVRK